jgi:hypothetical protein
MYTKSRTHVRKAHKLSNCSERNTTFQNTSTSKGHVIVSLLQSISKSGFRGHTVPVRPMFLSSMIPPFPVSVFVINLHKFFFTFWSIRVNPAVHFCNFRPFCHLEYVPKFQTVTQQGRRRFFFFQLSFVH